MLYKVTGAGHSVCVGGGGGVRGSEFNGAWGKREEVGRDGRELSFLTA